MIHQTIGALQELADRDPTVAPLARLQVEALRSAMDPAWEKGLPGFEEDRPVLGRPLLDGSTLLVDSGQVRRLLDTLLATVGAQDGRSAAAIAILEASINQDLRRLETLSAGAGVEPPLLATLGQLLALPLLYACGRRAAPSLAGLSWDAGYCPVCGAWPTLAEDRGMERRRWLRCGRCGSAWMHSRQICPFCGNRDHGTRGYLAPQGSEESRRATTCDRCHSFLKTLATLAPLDPEEVLLRDLSSLELDGAALGLGYARPEKPGCRVRATVLGLTS